MFALHKAASPRTRGARFSRVLSCWPWLLLQLPRFKQQGEHVSKTQQQYRHVPSVQVLIFTDATALQARWQQYDVRGYLQHQG